MATPHHTPTSRGQIVVFILILLASGLGLSMAVFSLMGRNAALVGIEISQERSLQLAEAGINRALYELTKNANWTGIGETVLGGGSYEVMVTDLGNSRLVEATGYIPSKANPRLSRTVRAIITDSPGADSFRYGAQSGTGGITLNSNATINGNAFSNANIVCYSNARITGDASAVGTITPLSCAQGTARQGVSPRPLPYFDSNYWKSAANQNPSPGCPISGNVVYSSGTHTLGPCQINGSLTLDNHANLILTGPLYVTGNFTMNANSQLSIDDRFGTNGTVLLADGTISPNSNSKINRVQQTAILRPDGDFSSAWSATPPGSHWSAIDDDALQPDAPNVSDYILASVDGQTDELNMATVGGIGTTTEITVWAYARNTDSQNGDRLGINIVVNGAAQNQQNINLTTAWSWVRATFTLATGQSGVDGLRVRLIQNRQGAQDSVAVAAMYAAVRYTLAGGGHIMLVSSSTSTSAITLNSNTEGGIFYALNGTVVANSNSHPVALTGKQLVINSNATILYDQGLPDQSFTSGPGGGWVIRRGTWRIIPK
jgi:hypothetical protein